MGGEIFKTTCPLQNQLSFHVSHPALDLGIAKKGRCRGFLAPDVGPDEMWGNGPLDSREELKERGNKNPMV
ncbi:MAG: hypothetical protein CM15mP47_3620 [Methanobacteriota archaeon]|nr:MAG: hypothetical protein CM15mP47_3620 [Euryarchaeota archaeon]